MLGADGWVAGLVNAFPDELVAIYQLAHGMVILRQPDPFTVGSCPAGAGYSSEAGPIHQTG